MLCEFTGGSQVINGWTGAAFGPAPASQVTAFLNQIEPIFPGVTAAYSGVQRRTAAYRDLWRLNPWTKGADTCQKPGQYTTIFGNGAASEGNVHFAGEHTSVDFFGYLNGAVESGERSAKENRRAVTTPVGQRLAYSCSLFECPASRQCPKSQHHAGDPRQKGEVF